VLPPPLTYQTWLADHFSGPALLDPAVSGPLADPDGDGLVNWIEYAAVKNPVAGSGPAVKAESLAGGKVRLTWERRRGAADVNEGTVALQRWDGTGIWLPVAETTGVTVHTAISGEGTDRQTVEFDPLLNPRQLFRLRGQP
jgi:hypothetical protein